MALNGRWDWDWLRLPEARPEMAPLLSPAAREGLVLARWCERLGISPRELAARVTVAGQRLGPRDVHRKITIAKIQIRRAETPRLCAACGRPLAPRQRSDSRYCSSACRQRGYTARLRALEQTAVAGSTAVPRRATTRRSGPPTHLARHARRDRLKGRRRPRRKRPDGLPSSAHLATASAQDEMDHPVGGTGLIDADRQRVDDLYLEAREAAVRGETDVAIRCFREWQRERTRNPHNRRIGHEQRRQLAELRQLIKQARQGHLPAQERLKRREEAIAARFPKERARSARFLIRWTGGRLRLSGQRPPRPAPAPRVACAGRPREPRRRRSPDRPRPTADDESDPVDTPQAAA
jgi:hypothetical protein